MVGIMNAEGGIMRGKRGLIMGVANSRSIAYGITKAVSAAGAQVALTYHQVKRHIDW